EVREAMAVLRTAAAAEEEPAGTLPDVVRGLLAKVGLTSEPPAGGASKQRWDSLMALVELAEEFAADAAEPTLRRYVGELEQRAAAQHAPTVHGVTLASLHAAKGLEWDAVFLVGLCEGTLPIRHAGDDQACAPGAPEPTLRRYGGGHEQRAAAPHAPTVHGVTLASLHAAKGLEWDAVFLVGLCEGTLPIQHADDDQAAIEEERRLLYVGVTRAREHLSLSWSLSRKPGGRRSRRRSRFLYGLVPEDHPAARVAQRGRGERPRCRVCAKVLTDVADVKFGRCSGCPSNVDPELLAALKEWRSDKARELRVPAYVVFTDATLMAIAEKQPTDDSELVSISGIGATKLERYGADVLAAVRKHTADA